MGGHAGGDTAGLEDEDFTGEFEECGWDASGFAGAGRGFNDEVGDAAEAGENLREQGVDWELEVRHRRSDNSVAWGNRWYERNSARRQLAMRMGTC
jgi:hypothetical protein